MLRAVIKQCEFQKLRQICGPKIKGFTVFLIEIREYYEAPALRVHTRCANAHNCFGPSQGR